MSVMRVLSVYSQLCAVPFRSVQRYVLTFSVSPPRSPFARWVVRHGNGLCIRILLRARYVLRIFIYLFMYLYCVILFIIVTVCCVVAVGKKQEIRHVVIWVI